MTVGIVSKALAVTTSLAVLGFATSSSAMTFFKVDPNPSNKTQINLTEEKDMLTDAASVGSVAVAVKVTGASDFAGGNATITPATVGKGKDAKTSVLTDLLFTPADPNAFNGFSFRGQDLAAGQVIDLIVQDNQGHDAETFTFTEGVDNQDFTRDGILAALHGESIKWVELQNSGGFKEAKQFAFGRASTSAAASPNPRPGR